MRPPVNSVYGGWLLPRLKQEQKFRCKILSIEAMPFCRMNIQLPNRRSRNSFRGFWLPLVLVLFFLNKAFGFSQQFSEEDLREYHYMFSMPYFEDQVELGEFEFHNQALETIETNLRNSENCIKVFRQTVKSQKTVLYGFGLKGTTGEGHFLPIIDIAEHKHTAFLPYELLVSGKRCPCFMDVSESRSVFLT